MDHKWILQSKTVWGAVITLLGAMNFNLPFTGEEGNQLIDALAIIIGTALTIYGRIKADKPLGFLPNR